jgi:hypothetical protein
MYTGGIRRIPARTAATGPGRRAGGPRAAAGPKRGPVTGFGILGGVLGLAVAAAAIAAATVAPIAVGPTGLN